MTWTIALHGGAYSDPEGDASGQESFLRELLPVLGQRLANAEPALEAVTEALRAMEDSGFFNAGKGAAANAHGDVELDAAVMEGHSSRAGAVAAVRGFRNPVLAARTIMETTKHVLLAGPLAERYLREQKLEEVSPGYFTHAQQHREHGTIGAVALDVHGHFAAATSTGGIAGKLPGRIGDSPIVGAGTWADGRCAVSCTGQGETFIRSAAAARLAFALGNGTTLVEAAQQALDAVEAIGGKGGLIAIDRSGHVAAPFVTRGMVRGWALPGEMEVHV
ncbi:MAG: isoaspartyl peptidase/L-asparaginase [Alphaproteobacteria bacterium]